jgi:hypothetical protein
MELLAEKFNLLPYGLVDMVFVFLMVYQFCCLFHHKRDMLGLVFARCVERSCLQGNHDLPELT